MAEATKATRAKASTAKAEDTAPVEDAAPEGEAAAPPAEPDSIPVERLLRDAVAFTGYEAHILAGALCDDDREALTPDEARAAAAAWLGE